MHRNASPTNVRVSRFCYLALRAVCCSLRFAVGYFHTLNRSDHGQVICVFALKEFNLKIQANNPAERTLKEKFAKNGMAIPI